MYKLKIDMTPDLEQLNEMFIRVEKSLPAKLENSIFYFCCALKKISEIIFRKK